MQNNNGDLANACDNRSNYLKLPHYSLVNRNEQVKSKFKPVIGLAKRRRVLLDDRQTTVEPIDLEPLYTVNPVEIPQRFPPEIIIRILRLALLDEPRPLRQLVRFSQVCETWRRIVADNSSIWVRLDTSEILPCLTRHLKYFKLLSETNTFSSCRDLVLASDTLFLQTFRETSLKSNPKCLSDLVQINPIIDLILFKASSNLNRLYLTNNSEVVGRHKQIFEQRCKNLVAIELGCDGVEHGTRYNYYLYYYTPFIISERLLQSNSASLREIYMHYPYQITTILPRLAKHCSQLTHLELGIRNDEGEPVQSNSEVESDSDDSSSSSEESVVNNECIDPKLISANFHNLKVFSCYSYEFTRTTVAPAILTEMVDLRELRLPILKGCDQTRDEWTLRILAQSSTKLVHLDARGCFLKVFSLGWLTTDKLRSLHLYYSVPSAGILCRWSSKLIYLTLAKISERYREHRSQGPANPGPELDACLEILADVKVSKLKYLDLSESDCGVKPVLKLICNCEELEHLNLIKCQRIPKRFRLCYRDKGALEGLKIDLMELPNDP